MAANLGTLTLDLVAKIGGFTGPLDKAGRAAKKTSADMAKYGKAIGVAIGAGAVAAASGIALIVNRQRDLIDQQAKAAQMLDTTYASLSNLARAGELGGVGMEKIEAASRQLNLNLGRAIQGTEAQVAAFDRLGLSAQDIFDLPLDQRIAKINQALRDNVQASERAAVAADIYGAKNAKALQQLDPGTIADAARQVEIFGLNLSDVDAAKVEMANDALSTFGLLGDGIAKQLTVELAPILKAVGDLFLESAEEAGGLGNVVQDSVQTAVNALAFLADAADGVKRVFELAADAIITGFSKASSIVANNAASILNVVSYLPGVDYSDTVSSLRQFATEANGVAREAMANIDQTLSRPLAGQAFKQFYADAQKAAEDSAQATIDAREEVKKTGDAFVEESSKSQKAIKQTVGAIDSQIRALQLQAEMVGMSTQEQTLYKLAVDGATASQLAQASAALTVVDAFEKQKKAMQEAADTKQYTAALRNQVKLAQNAVDIEVQAIGLGRKRADLLREINAIQQEYAQRIEELASAQGTENALSDAAYQARLEALREAMEQEVAIVEEGERRKEEARKNGINGAKRALEDYIENAKDLASQFEQTATSVLNGLEDSLTTFVLTGKISFKDLANSIIEDLARIAARQLTANLAQGVLGAVGGGAGGGGGLAAAFAGLFDSGGQIAAGQWGIVGERGPEIVAGPAAVTGRQATAEKLDRAIAMASNDAAGSGRPVTMQNHFDLSGMRDARQVREAQATISRAVARAVADSTRYT